MRPDRRRRQPAGHLTLDLELDPPPGAVARQQDFGVELLEVAHSLRHQRLVERADEVVPADDRVQRHRAASELEGVPRRVDHARVAAAGKDDDAFAYVASQPWEVSFSALSSPPRSGRMDALSICAYL